MTKPCWKNLTPHLAFILAFGGAAANAHALDYSCKDKEQLKEEMRAEGLVPVVRFYQDQGKKKSDFQETFFIMNPQTREGYRMDRADGVLAGKMCITAKITDIRLYNPQTLDERAYLDAANADKKGTGINNQIYGGSQVYGENPMFRGVEYSPFDKTTRITFVVANTFKGNEGGVLSSTLDGEWLRKYTKKIPNTQSGYANVDHGAIFTDAGAEIAAKQAAKP